MWCNSTLFGSVSRPGLSPLPSPLPPLLGPSSPPTRRRSGWLGGHRSPSTYPNLPLHSPLAPTRPRRPNHPLAPHSAPIHRLSAPVHLSRVRALCVRPSHKNTSFDTFTFMIHPQTAPVPVFHSPVHLTRLPLRRTLCAWSFVSHRFVSRTPSIHHLHTSTAFHLISPRGLSIKPVPNARAVEDAIA